MTAIDVNFDFRIDINYNGSDVDKYSHTLKQYHKILWSKPLPDGRHLNLDDSRENFYLHAQVGTQEFFLSSDSFSHTYSRWKRTKHIIEKIPRNEIEEFLDIAYTIGGYIIFPSNKVNNLPSINQERGTNSLICDRFDLTLECIRRYYNNEESPLFETLKRYNDFFQLFINLSTSDYRMKSEFPEMSGFSVTNLKYCKYFYTFYSEVDEVLSLSPNHHQLGDDSQSLDKQANIIRQQAVDELTENEILMIPWGESKRGNPDLD